MKKMNTCTSQQFSQITEELCNLLYLELTDLKKAKVNSLIDELNSKQYKADTFVIKHDASTLMTTLCLNIKPSDESLAAKTSHLLSNIITKQNLQFDTNYLTKVISWYLKCLTKCSDIILPDLLHNLQCILQMYPQASHMFINELIGKQGILINLIETNNSQNALQISLISLKCIGCLVSSEDKSELQSTPQEIKQNVSQIIIKFLFRGGSKGQDDFLYCKVIIAALRVLSQLYFNDPEVSISLPEVIGICRYFVLYDLVAQGPRPEKIMPAQQTIAATPQPINTRGGKKQKIRKQRNNAIESLKKDIPVSDRSLMKDVDCFENTSIYKPVSNNYLEANKARNCWTLTSDSDMSDVESSREAKLVALKSRVRQSAANLLLVLVKVKEKKEIFGYWWALLPDCPDVNNWSTEPSSRKTLAYCAVHDPIATSRTSVLSVILALLSGSRPYLYQAESSKRDNTSFIPFSISLGYTIVCLHKVLVSILDTERSHAVILVALKCSAALVQASPFHKLKEGLILELVRTTRKFLVHRDVTLQVGALITMGCVLSVDPKINEVLVAFEKDTVPFKISNTNQSIVSNMNTTNDDECDDFEEGYSDDEMFTAVEEKNAISNNEKSNKDVHYFKSWILDICLKNLGWLLRGDEVIRCKPSVVPVMLESLQVLTAVGFHYLDELLLPHLTLLADVLSEYLQHENQDVVLQSAKAVSVIGDAVQKLEHSEVLPPLNMCVQMWEKLISPLSSVLQNNDNAPAKAVACDCVANIGERTFKELPRRLQVLCCALLIGSCSDENPTVRGAAVRALAMAVLYKTLREDIGFVSDCGENILRALAEQTLVVRTKAAWALGTLSDALILNMDEPEADDIDDDLLLRLLTVSIECAGDDKVKMSATRGLGNLLRLIKDENLLRRPQIKTLCETAIVKLLECACKVTNMKVRWNACYALGNAMRNENLFTCFSGWQSQVFPSLCNLARDCKNLKVRINATSALRAPSTREQYGEYYTVVWRGVMAAMDNAANVDDFTEYRHKDNLIEQLCVTLAHLCCLLNQSDLADILDPLVFHYDCAKSLFGQVLHRLAPENSSCLKILQAAKYVTVDMTAVTDSQQQALGMLQDIFIWDML